MEYALLGNLFALCFIIKCCKVQHPFGQGYTYSTDLYFNSSWAFIPWFLSITNAIRAAKLLTLLRMWNEPRADNKPAVLHQSEPKPQRPDVLSPPEVRSPVLPETELHLHSPQGHWLQDGDSNSEELLMTMQKLGWEGEGKRWKALRRLFCGLRQPSRDRREQCRGCEPGLRGSDEIGKEK